MSEDIAMHLGNEPYKISLSLSRNVNGKQPE